ncbi:ATP-binding cassette domain-containing protein, partial [Roseateles sp.]|uniref:ATP-binding cassette domain-containing protein n=1 Tax=Roseateles sp. TaxID=1971397 RepID=UPI00286C540B
MTIGRHARAAVVGVETIRYYQQRAPLPVPSAGDAFRHYPVKLVVSTRFITRAHEPGFALDETAELLRLAVGTDLGRAFVACLYANTHNGSSPYACQATFRGGMQMRTSIARALVTKPTLLLMDEPFAALDEFTRHRLDADLSVLWQIRRLTVLFVTHSLQEAVFLSTRVIVMAARPARVLANVPIPAAYPRTPAFRGCAQFAALCESLSTMVARVDRVARMTAPALCRAGPDHAG